jgi:hypothetical protein
VRGIDGLEVLPTTRQHPCGPGQSVLHETEVRVPPGVSGLLVVDVSLDLEGGQQMTAARAFRLFRPGAVQSEKRQGTVLYDDQNNPIVVVPAQEK